MSNEVTFKHFDQELRTVIAQYASSNKPPLKEVLGFVKPQDFAAHSETFYNHDTKNLVISIEEFVGIYQYDYRSPYTLVITNEPKIKVFRGCEQRIKIIKKKFKGVISIPGMADFLLEYETSPELIKFNEEVKRTAIRRNQDYTKPYSNNPKKPSCYYFISNA